MTPYLSCCLHWHVALYQIVGMSCHSCSVLICALHGQSFNLGLLHLSTLKCESSELLSVSSLSDAEASRRFQCEELVFLSARSCSWVNVVIDKKSTTKRIIMSMRHACLSLFPAYLIALARANISFVVVSPKPSTIFCVRLRQPVT